MVGGALGEREWVRSAGKEKQYCAASKIKTIGAKKIDS